MELNPEAVLDALNDFGNRDYEISPVLEEYLQKIAKTGNILYPWNKLKPLLKRKMELVMLEFSKNSPSDGIPSYPNTDPFDYELLRATILNAVEIFPSAPFTIQRLCELITNPKKHYNRTDKYMRGLEKNLLVVSTVEPSDTSVSDRDQGSNNDWGNDSSNEEHNYSDAASNVPSAVNGTVLENFATVFPSATRLANPANNIQVAIVTDTNAYQQHSETLDYDMGNHVPEQKEDIHYENGIDTSENMDLIMSSSGSECVNHMSIVDQPTEKENESQPLHSTTLIKSKTDLSENDSLVGKHEQILVAQSPNDELKCTDELLSDSDKQPEEKRTASEDTDTVMEEVYKALNDDEMNSPEEEKSDEKEDFCDAESSKAEDTNSYIDEPEVKRRKLENMDEVAVEVSAPNVPEAEQVETFTPASVKSASDLDSSQSDPENQSEPYLQTDPLESSSMDE